MRRIALDQAKHERFHRHHVERLEGEVADLKERVHRLEERAGP
jgi:polyhydroxyalkanoate synthesis regulator phasin